MKNKKPAWVIWNGIETEVQSSKMPSYKPGAVIQKFVSIQEAEIAVYLYFRQNAHAFLVKAKKLERKYPNV